MLVSRECCPERQLGLDGGDTAHGDGDAGDRWTMRLGSLPGPPEWPFHRALWSLIVGIWGNYNRGLWGGGSVGALNIRIGFWGFLIIVIIVHYTPKPYSNYEGPCISLKTQV